MQTLMDCRLEVGFRVSTSPETFPKNAHSTKVSPVVCDSLQSKAIMGKSLRLPRPNASAKTRNSIHASVGVVISQQWWKKGHRRNTIEIHSAQELVDSLLKAGDRLVVVHFYSPVCGGCKALHPKVCQLAESNPNAVFLNVNHEQLRTMCHCLHINVLPFFRFYGGAQGKLCSFSCTNATIKKFKDAFAKFGNTVDMEGPAKGLDESEILSLASSGQLSSNCKPSLCHSAVNPMGDLLLTAFNMGFSEENALLV